MTELESKGDQAGAAITNAAPATIPAAALDSIRKLAGRKGLAESDLLALAGKPLDTLTVDEANALAAKVSAHKKPAAADEGRPFE